MHQDVSFFVFGSESANGGVVEHVDLGRDKAGAHGRSFSGILKVRIRAYDCCSVCSEGECTGPPDTATCTDHDHTSTVESEEL
jgi:hypothetical protein